MQQVHQCLRNTKPSGGSQTLIVPSDPGLASDGHNPLFLGTRGLIRLYQTAIKRKGKKNSSKLNIITITRR